MPALSADLLGQVAVAEHGVGGEDPAVQHESSE
jgi:hypothetical protein